MDLDKVNFITHNFFKNTQVLSINLIDTGLINKTYIIEHLSNGIKSKFILQSLSNIFESHELININHNLITDHFSRKIKEDNLNLENKRWEVPSLIRCNSNNLFMFPFDSDMWRAMVYIENAFSPDILEDKINKCTLSPPMNTLSDTHSGTPKTVANADGNNLWCLLYCLT